MKIQVKNTPEFRLNVENTPFSQDIELKYPNRFRGFNLIIEFPNHKRIQIKL